MTSLVDSPPNISIWRQRLFEVSSPIRLSIAEYNAYWPYVDNVWVRHRSRESKRDKHVTEYWYCRQQRATWISQDFPDGRDSQGEPSLKWPRKKPKRAGSTCNMRIRILQVERLQPTDSYVEISRLANCGDGHTHDLPNSDMLKRNSALLATASTESAKGYAPATVNAAIGFEDWQCNCQFWVSYQLPCSHLLQIDLLFHVITDSMWDTYKHLFKDGGLEIYEKAGQDYTKEVVFTEVGAPAKRRLEMRRELISYRQRSIAWRRS